MGSTTQINNSTVMGLCSICLEQVSLEEQQSELYLTHTQCSECAETKHGQMAQKIGARKQFRFWRSDANGIALAVAAVIVIALIAVVIAI
jgi:hypothetical protein